MKIAELNQQMEEDTLTLEKRSEEAVLRKLELAKEMKKSVFVFIDSSYSSSGNFRVRMMKKCGQWKRWSWLWSGWMTGLKKIVCWLTSW